MVYLNIVRVTFIIASLTLSGCAIAPKPNIAHAGFIAATALDIDSTQRALDAGFTERNPLYGSRPTSARMVAVKLAGWALLRTLENTLEKEIGRGLKWYERILFWAIPTGVTAWAAKHNYDLTR